MINQRLVAKIMIALFMIVSLSALTIYGLPLLLKPKILATIQQATGRNVAFANVQLEFLPLSIQLQNFTIEETDGKPFASFDSFYIKVNVLQSLKQSALVIDNLALVKPVVRIVKQKNGAFNFSPLFKESGEQQHSSIFPVNITKLSLSEGKLAWEDGATKETIQPINLTINNLSAASNAKSQLLLQLALNSGGKLDWQGEISFNPLHSTGHIKLNDIKLQQLLTVTAPESIAFSFSGHELFDTDYKISYVDKQLNFTADKAKIELRDFQYTDKELVIKTPSLLHETDIKINYANGVWSLSANKANINLRDFQLTATGTTNLAIKTATLSHETDYKAQFAQNSWQFSANKTKIDGSDLQLDYLDALFKTPTIAVESGIETHSTDNGVSVVTTQGKLNSRHVQLFEKNQTKPLIDIVTLALSGSNIDLNKQAVVIDSINADNADFRTWLNPKGTFNYQTLFTPSKTEVLIAAATASKTTPWAINVNNVAFTKVNAIFEDRTLTPTVITTINPIDFKLTGYSNKTGEKLPFQLNAGMNKTGHIHIDGDAIIEPFSTHLAVNAQGIDLEPFQAYLEKIAHLDIIDGQLSTNGNFTISMPENNPLDLKFKGNSSIAKFITRDQNRHKDFITWNTLSLTEIAIDLKKASYTADALIINKPYARVTIKKDKTINFSDIFITDSHPAQPSTVPVNANVSQQPYFKLSKIQIIDGSSDFADNSLILPFAAQIKSLDGGASDISSEKKSIIKVSLKGNAYDLAPVTIDGHISPYLGDYDLSLDFKGMPMPLISSYMVEFAGYKVEKGKMSLVLKYKVVNDELTASNNILIDQFELGEKVDNPRAVSLPLELAVALLKDADGKMKIDVPITGSLNNPQFDIGTIISDALMNAISKVVSAPFRAIATLTDSDEDISVIKFNAGKSILNTSEQQKLTTLAKAMKQRSALILDIKGAAFQTQDWPTMKEAALVDLLKKIRADEMTKQSGKKILAEYVELSDTEYKRLLAELFIEKFPNLAKKSLLLGTPELIDAKAGDFYVVAKEKLSVTLKNELPRLKKLAAQRAQAIASYLVQGGVPNEQVFILDTIIDPKRDDNEIASLLTLKTN